LDLPDVGRRGTGAFEAVAGGDVEHVLEIGLIGVEG